MQAHQLTRSLVLKKETRIGRGGKRGTYSGRGIKGMGARAGGKRRPAEREILKKIPKLRGYKFKSFHKRMAVVNMGSLEKKFKEGDVVSPESLVRAGLVSRVQGKMPKVKILGSGSTAKKFTFKGVIFSRAAAEKRIPSYAS